MNSVIDKHLLNYLIYKISSHTFAGEYCTVSFKRYWNNKEYDFDATCHQNYEEYLKETFNGLTPSSIIDGFANSKLNIELTSSIIQYILLYVSRLNYDDLDSKIDQIREKIDKINKDDDSNDDSNDNKTIEKNTERSLKKLRKLKYSIRRNTDDLSSEISNSQRETSADISILSDVVKNLESVENLERKIDIIDDKFNLLSSFIDIAANK